MRLGYRCLLISITVTLRRLREAQASKGDGPRFLARHPSRLTRFARSHLRMTEKVMHR